MDLVSQKDGVLLKAKWIFSSLRDKLLWTSRLLSPVQISQECYHFHQRPHEAGLKTLVYSQGEVPLQNTCPPPIVINSHMVSSASPKSKSSSWSSSSTPSSSLTRSLSPHSSSSWSSVLDDLIGTENGVCMNPYHEEEIMMGVVDKEKAFYNCNASKWRQRPEMKKEYPPPIPLLVRTGNFRGHMPWVFTRHYSNRRLILKEERMKHQQYLEAYRENGRLILKIVQLDYNMVTWSDAISKKNTEDVEPEDLEFIKEEEADGYTSQETEGDDIEVDVTTHDYEGSSMILRSQHIPNIKTRLDDQDEEHEALCKRSTCTARSTNTYNPNFLCNANTQEHMGCTYLAQYSRSVPLAFHVRRMTPVM